MGGQETGKAPAPWEGWRLQGRDAQGVFVCALPPRPLVPAGRSCGPRRGNRAFFLSLLPVPGLGGGAQGPEVAPGAGFGVGVVRQLGSESLSLFVLSMSGAGCGGAEGSGVSGQIQCWEGDRA